MAEVDIRSMITEGLILAADVGLTFLFYRLYRSKCSTADQIQEMEPLDWSSLKNYVASQPDSSLEYGLIEGTSHSINGSLKSQFTDEEGSIKFFKRVLLKAERHRGYWADTSSTISETYNKVPFALFDGKDKKQSMLVVDPRSADYLHESLHTTYDQFEPHTRSLTESIFDRVVGEITKGYQTTEQILKNGTAMLGVGKIVLNKGSLELRKPTRSSAPYILTTMTKEELIQHLKSRATIFKVMTGIFGVAGVLILWVTAGARIRQWIDNRRSRAAMEEIREQLAQMRQTPADSSPSQRTPTDDQNVCVICLSSAREIANRPCGHVCSCLSCYESTPSPKLCPVCRAAVREVIPIFIP